MPLFFLKKTGNNGKTGNKKTIGNKKTARG